MELRTKDTENILWNNQNFWELQTFKRLWNWWVQTKISKRNRYQVIPGFQVEWIKIDKGLEGPGELREGAWMDRGRGNDPACSPLSPPHHSRALCDLTGVLWCGFGPLVHKPLPMLSCLMAAVWFRRWRITSLFWKVLLLPGWAPVSLPG